MSITSKSTIPSNSHVVPRYRGLQFIIPTTILLIILIIGFVMEGSQQYSMLAQAFLHGQLNFLKPIGGAGQDPVYWHGKIYWSEGPFPAIILMPFVWFFSLFHLFYFQGYLKWLLVLGVVYLVFKLAKYLKYSNEDSLLLAFGFVLGSVFIGVASASASWFYAQVVNTLLMFWALYEYYGRRRWWLLGAICGLIFMTRATSIPIVVFFVLECWGHKKRLRQLITPLTQFGLPIFGAVCLIGVYNFVRFHSIFNGGYADQVLFSPSAESQSYGVFSLVHIPTNLYSLLLRMPVPILRSNNSWTLKFPFFGNNVYGMSIFVTSPYLLYLFTQKWSSFDKRSRHLLIAAALSALLVLSYFGVGLVQFGYRYSLDFLPELFLLFMIMYRKQHTHISRGMRFVLIGAGVLNFYMLWQLLL